MKIAPHIKLAPDEYYRTSDFRMVGPVRVVDQQSIMKSRSRWATFNIDGTFYEIENWSREEPQIDLVAYCYDLDYIGFDISAARQKDLSRAFIWDRTPQGHFPNNPHWDQHLQDMIDQWEWEQKWQSLNVSALTDAGCGDYNVTLESSEKPLYSIELPNNERYKNVINYYMDGDMFFMEFEDFVHYYIMKPADKVIIKKMKG